MLQLKSLTYWGAWVPQWVERPRSAQVTTSRFASLSPMSRSLLSAQSLLHILCRPFSLPLPRSFIFSLSLSKRNKNIENKLKNKIFDILIHTRNNGKIIVIEFYQGKFLFQHTFPDSIARPQISFYFPGSIKCNLFICSVTSVRNHKSHRHFFVTRIILPLFLSLVIEHLASISFKKILS